MVNKTTPKGPDISSLIDGAPQIELYLLQTVMILCMLMRNLIFPIIGNGRKIPGTKKMSWLKFLIDYFFVIIPGVLSMTIVGYHMHIFALVLLFINFILLMFTFIEYIKSGKPFPFRNIMSTTIDESFYPTTFLTIFRGSMLVQIGVAILAVDFQVFPNKFAKTVHYGHSVMDIGVAACIIADGMASTLKRFRKKREQRSNSPWSVLWSSRVVLPVLGFLRIFFLWLFDYGHSYMEYGQHWNFFFTMAVVAIVARILPRTYPISISLFFTILHFYALSEGREEFILIGHNPRDNLVLANIEGITSITGYLAMYYAAAAVGVFISNTTDDLKSWCWLTVHIYIIAFLFYAAQIGTEWVGFLPSRRVCNITFVLSQLSLLIYAVALLLLIQSIVWFLFAAQAPRFSSYDAPFEAIRPCLQDTINLYGLLYFLGCNILTGAVNMSINTTSVDDPEALGILFVYMFLISALAHFLKNRSQKVAVLV